MTLRWRRTVIDVNTGYASYDAPRVRRPRPSAFAHTVVVLGAWALAVFVTLAVAADTKIGPVVLRITTNHGLHEGDVVTLAVMSLLAAIVTVVVAVQFWVASRRYRAADRA